ncbi:MAG: LytTR family DNA-binding domain-containing protein [Paenibacillus macerans]|uniref:Response regulator n=2 Tax=Paenibacillus macerans TaxID=44252 RepID=A0A090ZFD2_PAEMA|nr:LytTR family DNA-binding domain-containing protein [Paenibacillus macerans]KFN10019.1 response regulator [Paenibacillus macerans]MCY7560970.1 LytTR family DNA-binding domain-containing protein [Paenibacillus macerans]MDU7473370.1 LytTR family DNA-binding domain-containing protein [Paenibacillus macerans]MEC0153611.1 LytTR family DNA-binding domain-containing protein [Paenibacillus macerans]SUD26989.1 Chemotaxis response regulator protein-glutamate methylesterase [Paenibacillus macerans]
MLHIALCDDMKVELSHIENLVLQYPFSQVEVDAFGSGQKLLQYVIKNKMEYNIYLLDIDMPEMDGISLAQKIREFDRKAVIIFITGYNEYMKDVFKVQTFDYLLKPVSKDAFFEVLQRADSYLNSNHSYFEFNYERNKLIFNTDEILYFEKSGRTAYIHTTTGVLKCNQTITQILSQLDPLTFIQIHASYIINLRYVYGIKYESVLINYDINMKHPETLKKLPISRKYKKDFKEKMIKYMRKAF